MGPSFIGPTNKIALPSQNRVLKQNNVELSRDLEDVSLKLELLVADSATTDDSDKENFVRAEMEKQVSLARTQRDEAVVRLHQLQEKQFTLDSRLEEAQDAKTELETRLLVAESSLSTAQSESAHLRESLARTNANASSSGAHPTVSSHSGNSASSGDLELLETLKLEVDELRAMKPMIEVLERDASRIPDLERTIDNLKLELTTARSRRMNEEALSIQVEASGAVQKQLEATISSLTQQNVKLKEEALVWAHTMESLGSDSGRSAEEVKSYVFELQAENLALLDKLGASEAQLKISASHVQAAQKRLKEAESTIFDLKTERSTLQGSLAQKDGKILLCENEVQGMRSLLESYKLEDDVGGYDVQKTAHINALEATLAERTSYMKALESEVEELKNELTQLSKHAKRMTDEKGALEHRLGRGEIDASRTRVLHFSESPLHIMLAKDAQLKSAELEAKVETLTAQLNAVEKESSTSGGAKHIDSALHVQQEKEMKMLRHQFQETKVAMDRMKSATEVAIRRYMSSVWNVFGWKVDFEEKNRVKVRYKYWNDKVRLSQAVLLFEYPTTLGQKGVNDQLEPFTLLDSPYSQHIPTEIVEVLRQPNSLPLFIAKLTQHLFEMVAAAGHGMA